MIVAAATVAAVALVLALTVFGGSSGSGKTGSSSAGSRTGVKASRTPGSSTRPAVPANAAETSVAVLNATETNGLAHRVSGELQRAGYAQAAPLSGRPPGAGQTSVVEYAGGYRADAEAVARSLAVSQVQPVEPAVTALSGSASVVVILGADKASAGT